MGNVKPIIYCNTSIIYTDNMGKTHRENVTIQENRTFSICDKEFRIDKGQLKMRKFNTNGSSNPWQNAKNLEFKDYEYGIFNNLANLVDENKGKKTLSMQDVIKYEYNKAFEEFRTMEEQFIKETEAELMDSIDNPLTNRNIEKFKKNMQE